jgi:hypothetical protein
VREDPALTVCGVQRFSVPVSDQDRAGDFCVDVCWVRVRPHPAETAVTLVTWFHSMPAGSSTGLQAAPWGRYIQVQDPDGNGLVLQETEPGSGRLTDDR